MCGGKMTIRKRPFRSPIEIPYLVREYLKDKSFCEIGCAFGDLLKEFKKYAVSTTGIEINDLCWDELDKISDVKIIKGDFFKNIPKADVYYFWCQVKIDKKVVNCLPKSATLITHSTIDPVFHDYYMGALFPEESNLEFIKFMPSEDPACEQYPAWPHEPLQVVIRPGI
jgi:hypothetical protein